MSQVAIRAALEVRLNSMVPALATAWENVPFAPPVATTPYQRVNLLFARPDNFEMGSGYTEQGYMQVTLLYPLSGGSAPAMARAAAIRAHFPKNLSLTHSGFVTTINRTPEISNGVIDGDRWSLPVRIPFHAHIY